MTFHVVWDWNCTLYNDLPILARCTSISSQHLGGPTVSIDDYRRHYTRPVDLSYERVLGRPVTTEEMFLIGEVFHAHYAELKDEATLADDALQVLARVSATGATQSILTMWLHDQLVPLVDQLGIAHHFSHLQGQPQMTANRKAESLAAHLATLNQSTGLIRDQTNTVMVGDTVDDGEAARANGISCVLLTTGPNGRCDLAETGWPVCDSLTEAADLLMSGQPLVDLNVPL